MKKKVSALVSGVCTLILMVVLLVTLSLNAKEIPQENKAMTASSASSGVLVSGDVCTEYTGDNVEDQNYSTWASTVKSYLEPCDDGTWMRVQYVASLKQVVVEHYSSTFVLLDSNQIALELPIFGAFYAMNENYYLLTGQMNEEEVDTQAVYCVTKYDENWNRLSSCSLYGANTYIPFDAGSARMTNIGQYLLIRTCHEMYLSSDGNHHQASVTIEVDTNTMTISDSTYVVGNNGTGYVSHSFNEFLAVVDNKLVAVDHGDAYPRSIVLLQYANTCNDGTFCGSGTKVTTIKAFEGEIGQNYTGASVGGFEVSNTSFLTAYNEVMTYGTSTIRDIYIGAVNRSTNAVTTTKLTSCTAESKNCYTPHLVKVSDTRFLVLWYQDGKVFYTLIDGNGGKVGTAQSMIGDLSDCKPVYRDGKVTWYVWDGEDITFYSINLTDMTSGKTTVRIGHNYVFGTAEEGMITRTCTKCDMSEEVSIPTQIRFCYWNNYSGYTTPYGVGTTISCSPSTDNDDAVANDILITSDNPSVLEVLNNEITANQTARLYAGKAGVANITVTLKHDPSVTKTFSLRVGEIGSCAMSDCEGILEQSTYIYTGLSNQPEPTVTYEGKLLTKGRDYTVTYGNNKELGTGRVTITGKGLFSGTLVKEFTIRRAALEECDIALTRETYSYRPGGVQATVSVTYGKQTIPSSFYTLVYENNNSIGRANVICTPDGTNLIGEAEKLPFQIVAMDLTKATIDYYPTTSYLYTYTGTARRPFYYIIVDGEYISSYSSGLTVTLTNNVNVGEATVVVSSNDPNVIGSLTSHFDIVPADISGYTMELTPSSLIYNGTEQKPSITIRNDSGVAISTDGYEVVYSGCKVVGEGTVTVTGKGNYKGELSSSVTVSTLAMTEATVRLAYESTMYDGSSKTPAVTVLYDGKTIPESEYTVSYTNNINEGEASVTVTGKNNVSGTVVKTFHIGSYDMSRATCTLSKQTYSYDGQAKTPTVTVTLGGETLTLGTEYTLSYMNNTNAGEASVRISGIGQYAGEVTKTYQITAVSIVSYTATLSETEYYYDGGAKCPAITLRSSTGQVLDAANYSVIYTNNTEIGEGTVSVHGVGNYSGSKSLIFVIRELIPESFEVWWKKADDITGYYWSYYDSYYLPGDIVDVWVDPDVGTAEEDMEVLSSNAEVVSVYCENGEYYLNMNQPGSAVITVRAKKNTSLAATYDFVVTYPPVKVSYRTHVQSYGWQNYVQDGSVSGTVGKSKRLESINIRLYDEEGNIPENLGIQYTTHVQSYGWLPWAANNDISGTEGESKRLEAIMIRLTGTDAAKYDVYYRVHAQSYGWLAWAKNGEPAGTAGYSKRLEGIQIMVVPKGTSFQPVVEGITSSRSTAYVSKTGASVSVPGQNMTNIVYRTHVQSVGWQGWRYNGKLSGTSGQSLRLEAIMIKLTNAQYSGGISYMTHIKGIGWENSWHANGQLSGTSGQGRRLEAIRIQLTGEMALRYDVYYRVHAQSFGWLDWAKNGASAGTAGYGKRLEAIEMVLVPKGGEAPGNTTRPYVSK